jgi:uncharacterized protein YycO
MKKILIILTIFIFGCHSNQDEPAKINPALKAEVEGSTPTVIVANNPTVEVEKPPLKKEIQNGDLIFHTSTSGQSLAIQIASNSKYSHVGMIYQDGGKDYVLEAVQPVKLTPLTQFINRGENKHYVVKRLKNSDEFLTPEGITKMKTIGKKYLNKNYDLKFEWSDDKIYCSELVWKIYDQAFGIKIGILQQIKDFDLSDPVVKAKAKQRYGNNIPLEELIITPDRMFQSDQLVTIIEK